jgi:Phage major capsid protein E
MIGNVLDVFRSDAFSFASMIARFDSMQFVPGQAASLGIWTPDSISTEVAFVEERDQILQLVQSSPHGAEGQQINDGKRLIKAIPVPHLQQNDRVYVHQVANVREFGTTNAFQSVESVVNRRLSIGETNFTGTEEHLMMGALQGIVYDADGTTPLADLYTIFNKTKEVEATYTFHITAGNAASVSGDGTLKKACLKIVRKIRDNLRLGGVIPQVYCFASPEFMDAFTSSNELRTNYQRYVDATSMGQVGAFLREGQLYGKPPFPYGEILFEEYRGGNVPASKAIFFPILPAGLPPLYPYVYAPATEYPDTVNTLGRPRYARVAVDPLHGKWVDIEMSTNPLPICLRPTALITTSFD